MIHTYTISLISDYTSHKFNILDLNRVNLIMKLIFKNVLIVLSSMSMSKIWTIIYSRLFVFLRFQLLKLSSITWLYGQSIDLRIVYKKCEWEETRPLIWPLIYYDLYFWGWWLIKCILKLLPLAIFNWFLHILEYKLLFLSLDLAQNFVKSTSKFLVGYMTIPLLMRKFKIGVFGQLIGMPARTL